MSEIIIEINNSFSKLINCPKGLRDIIWDKLSYEKTNATHLKVKTGKFWIDHKKHLLNRKTMKFPTGLLNNVIEIITQNGIIFKLNDLRVCPEPCLFLPANFEFEDRYYQADCLNLSDEFFRGTFDLCTGAGKCVKEDSLVLSELGLLKIKDFFNPEGGQTQELACNVFDGDKKVLTSHIYKNGFSRVKKIKTIDGYEIEGTLHHKIKVLDKNGDKIFKKLEDLKISDLIPISFDSQIYGNQSEIKKFHPSKKDQHHNVKIYPLPAILDEDLSYLIGALIGDGCLSVPKCIYFTNKDREVISYVQSIFKKHFNVMMTQRTEIEYAITSSWIKQFFANLDLKEVKSLEKEIPRTILRSSKNNILSFLSGLIDTDGHVNTKGNIEIGLSSKKLIEQIRTVLLNIGIPCRQIRIKTTHNDAFRLIIYGEYASKLGQLLNLKCSYKKQRFKTYFRSFNTNKDGVPLKDIENLIIQISESYKDVIKNWILWPRNLKINKLLTRKNALKLCTQLKAAGDSLYWRKLEEIFHGFIYQKISAIEDSECVTYDFVVPENHTFIANGIINHNTHLMARLIHRRKLPTLITVPRKGLLKQTIKELTKAFGKKYVGSHKEKKTKLVTVMTDASLRRMDQEFFDNFKMLILDESHHSAAKTYLDANKDKWNHIYYRYFLSGTPFRNDGSDLELKGIIGETLYSYPATKAIEDGFLVPPYFFIYEVPNDTFDRKYASTLNFQDEYEYFLVKNEKRNKMIIDLTHSLQKKKPQILLLVERKEHGKYLESLIKDSTYIDGDSSKINEKTIEDFEMGKINTLIATSGVMGEGIDIKNVNILMICGGYKAESQVIQKIGRILRKKEGKTQAILVDFWDKNTRSLIKHSKSRLKVYETYKTKITRIS